jgi:hypothetical protein
MRYLIVPMLMLVAGWGGATARAASPASAPATTQDTKTRTFTNKKHGIRFKVPASMEYQNPGVPGVVALYQTKRSRQADPEEQVQMLVIESGTTVLSDVIDGMKKKVVERGGKVLGDEATKLGGVPAHSVTSSMKVADQQREMKQIVTIRDRKAYVLSFIAQDGKLDEMTERLAGVIESFEWLK